MKSFSNFIQEARTADEISAEAREQQRERSADARKRLRAKRDAIKANTDTRLGGASHNEETILEYGGQAITNTTQGGGSGTRDDMNTKPAQPSLLKRIQGKRDAKKATNNVAKQAGQSVKNATDNTAGTGSQRKAQPYSQANKTASAKPEKGGAITKTAEKKPATVVKKPIAQVKVHSGRPQIGSAQRPDLAGAKPRPMIAAAPQQKQLPSGNTQRKALPAANS
tara:strand:- start:844 stop:1515 length:672 start_codon:yes stop_codon:yes gene_type:complete